MKKLKEFISNNWGAILAILFAITFLRMCSVDRTNKKLVKSIGEIALQVDSLKKVTPSTKYLELMYDKKMYEYLRLSLYDWNTVVRTTQRPDDIIQGYNKKIDGINEELKRKQ